MPAVIGRPTKYRAEYCDEALAYMGEGYSLTALAGHIGVSRETIYEWERTIPEFSDAIKIARARRVMALERQLLESINGPTTTARIFALKNACPDEWREKVSTELSGPNGGPIETRELSPLELGRRIAFALEKARRELESASTASQSQGASMVASTPINEATASASPPIASHEQSS